MWHSAQPSANAGYIVAQHTAQPAQPADQALAAALQSADESAHVSNSLKHVDETSMQPASQRASASSRPRSSDGSGVALLAPDPLAAALGGLLALTGGVLSYALVRVRGSGKRVRHLKGAVQWLACQPTPPHARAPQLADAAHLPLPLLVLLMLPTGVHTAADGLEAKERELIRCPLYTSPSPRD